MNVKECAACKVESDGTDPGDEQVKTKRKPLKPVQAWAIVKCGQIIVGPIWRTKSQALHGSFEGERVVPVEIREVVKRRKRKP